MTQPRTSAALLNDDPEIIEISLNLIRSVAFAGKTVEEAARALGLTAGNAYEMIEYMSDILRAVLGDEELDV